MSTNVLCQKYFIIIKHIETRESPNHEIIKYDSYYIKNKIINKVKVTFQFG